MKSHELAKLLLDGPDVEVMVRDYEWGWDLTSDVEYTTVQAYKNPRTYAGTHGQDDSMQECIGDKIACVTLCQSRYWPGGV